MLVLSRRTDERIMIGNDIVVTVLKIQHDQVRIGIEAPRDVDVHREEVYEALRQANVAAAAAHEAGLDALRRTSPLRPAIMPEEAAPTPGSSSRPAPPA